MPNTQTDTQIMDVMRPTDITYKDTQNTSPNTSKLALVKKKMQKSQKLNQ